MSTIRERLREMLDLPGRRSAGQYAGAVRTGDLVFVSGAGPVGPEGMMTGKVGADVDAAKGQEAAKLCALNCLAALEEEPGDLDRVRRIVKVWGYVNSAPGFSQQHVVMDGASSFLLSLFGERAAHARTSVGVAELPFGIPVEVEHGCGGRGGLARRG